MKLCVAILLITLGVSCARIINDNGQPGCKTATEIEVRNYRNIWDPTAIWVCEKLGTPAGMARCPDGQAWVESKKQCVDWELWEWEEAVEPPSRP